MKARRKGTDKPFEEVEVVQLRGSYILNRIEDMEFEHDTLSTGLQTYDQLSEEQHWQDVRERAAITAMQGTITILGGSDESAYNAVVVEGYTGKEKTYPKEIAQFAVACADALVEQLKKK